MGENNKEVTIKLANTAGFCFGVKRAVNTVKIRFIKVLPLSIV